MEVNRREAGREGQYEKEKRGGEGEDVRAWIKEGDGKMSGGLRGM